MDQNPTVPTALPVFRIIGSAFQFVWDKKSRMVRALFFPAVVISVLEYSTPSVEWISSDPGAFGHTLLGWLSYLIQTALYTLFAIICHRLALIGDHSVPDYGLLTWTKRESRYLGWFFVIMIIWMLYSYMISSLYVSTTVNDIEAGASVEPSRPIRALLSLPYIAFLYTFCRLSVLYPAISLDQPVTAQWAWQLTAHNGWRLTFVVGVLPGILYALLNLLLRENTTIVGTIIHNFIGFVLLAVEIVALSFSYKHLTEQVAPPAPGP